MTAFLAILIIAVVVSVVGYPLLRPSAAMLTIPFGPITALEDRKLQIYADIRELGFDYRMDKLEEADYEVEVEQLKSEAIGVVQQIEELRSQTPRAPDDLEAEIAAYREHNDFQTILGGIGYIVGLFGLGFYLAARRRLAV